MKEPSYIDTMKINGLDPENDPKSAYEKQFGKNSVWNNPPKKLKKNQRYVTDLSNAANQIRNLHFKDNRKYRVIISCDSLTGEIRVYLNHKYEYYQKKYGLKLPKSIDNFPIIIHDNILDTQCVIRNCDIMLSGPSSYDPDIIW